MHERAEEVGLVELEQDDRAPALLGQQQVDRRVERVAAPRRGDLRQPPALRVGARGAEAIMMSSQPRPRDEDRAAAGDLGADARA